MKTIRCEVVEFEVQCVHDAKLVVEELDHPRREIAFCWAHALAFVQDRHALTIAPRRGLGGQGRTR